MKGPHAVNQQPADQTPAPKPKKSRSSEHLAAGAAIQLAKLDAAIVKARETVTEKEAEKVTLLASLDEPVRVLVRRMRGESVD